MFMVMRQDQLARVCNYTLQRLTNFSCVQYYFEDLFCVFGSYLVNCIADYNIYQLRIYQLNLIVVELVFGGTVCSFFDNVLKQNK